MFLLFGYCTLQPLWKVLYCYASIFIRFFFSLSQWMMVEANVEVVKMSLTDFATIRLSHPFFYFVLIPLFSSDFGRIRELIWIEKCVVTELQFPNNDCQLLKVTFWPFDFWLQRIILIRFSKLNRSIQIGYRCWATASSVWMRYKKNFFDWNEFITKYGQTTVPLYFQTLM